MSDIIELNQIHFGYCQQTLILSQFAICLNNIYITKPFNWSNKCTVDIINLLETHTKSLSQYWIDLTLCVVWNKSSQQEMNFYLYQYA